MTVAELIEMLLPLNPSLEARAFDPETLEWITITGVAYDDTIVEIHTDDDETTD